jgi:4-hydroxy-2-oxoheptanedioate aldolase
VLPGIIDILQRKTMTIYAHTGKTNPMPNPRLTLEDGQAHQGVWVSLRDPAVVDVLAGEGFDWICIDGQHGGPEPSEMQPLIEASHLLGTPCIVRVPGHDPGTITRVLDAGAGGIIFPTVEDAAAALDLVAATRFAPRGKRSYGPTRVRPWCAPPTPGNPKDDALCILMVETAAGLANLDDILATGPDGVFVGPYDLSISLGITFEELTGEGPDGILADIARRCTAAGVTPGIYAGDPVLSEKMLDLGFRFMPVASDTGLLASAARAAMTDSRRYAPAKVIT